MLKTIDTKFRFLTHKIINFLSKSMILLFFCILISTSAKYLAKYTLNFIETKTRKIKIFYDFQDFNFDTNSFKKKNNFNWFKLTKFDKNKNFKFDVFLTDSLEEVQNLSKMSSLYVLDTEFLKITLNNDFEKINFSELKDFIILHLENNKILYLAVNKNTKFINLNYEIISAFIYFIQSSQGNNLKLSGPT